jgi:hypothetical protein
MTSESERKQSEDFVIPWTEYFAALQRRRRFIVIGTLAAWTLVVVAALVVPRQHVCEATLALPDLSILSIESRQAGVRVRSGMPLATYKRLERSLNDMAGLHSIFQGRLDNGELRSFQREMRNHVRPLTSATRDEIVRIESDDTVVGVMLSYEDSDPARAQEIVNMLAGMVREILATNFVMDAIDADLLGLRAEAAKTRLHRLMVARTNESLIRQANDLEAIRGRFGDSGGGPGREVVSISDGGHRYLPPAVQIVGVASARAENEHSMRVSDQQSNNLDGRIRFLLRLHRALQQEAQRQGGNVVRDTPTLVRRELGAFGAGQPANAGVAEFVRLHGNSLADTLDILRSSVRFIESPSLQPRGRLPFVLAGLAASVVVVLLAAFVLDLGRSRTAA